MGNIFREQLLEYTPRAIQLLLLNVFHVINYYNYHFLFVHIPRPNKKKDRTYLPRHFFQRCTTWYPSGKFWRCRPWPSKKKWPVGIQSGFLRPLLPSLLGVGSWTKNVWTSKCLEHVQHHLATSKYGHVSFLNFLFEIPVFLPPQQMIQLFRINLWKNLMSKIRPP